MIRLIVNADDFGEFRCVSDGILDCVAAGTVTATGVMTAGPLFDELAGKLAACPWLDCGVHLNLSRGTPLTGAMAELLSLGEGMFPGKGRAMLAVATGAWPIGVVALEWRAQIEKALDAGLRICFLNAHEHVHLMPSLRRLIVELARSYGIQWVRGLRAERPQASAAAWLRVLAAASLQCLPPAVPDAQRIDCVGLAASGRLDLAAVRRIFERFPSDGIFELMCHPGRRDEVELKDPSMLAYHDWEGERSLLCSPAFVELCAEFEVELIGFRDVSYRENDQIEVCR